MSVRNRRTDEGVHPTNHDVVLGQVLTARNGTHCMSARPSLVIASRNVKKRREIEELLAPHGIEVLSVADISDVPEVAEDGATFAENAAKKATQTARHLNRWVLGEDSGLMVDALGGAPGVYSARFSGEGASDKKNNAKL